MSRDATFGGDAIRRQFSELAGVLENELTVYLIGGGALTLDDLKNATKDIDLIRWVVSPARAALMDRRPNL